MKNLHLSLTLLLTLPMDLFCYPVINSVHDSEATKNAIKSEKHYPNGTIVGKIKYLDKEGNPVQLKYFADDASYGVELKSLKVIKGNTQNPLDSETVLKNNEPSPIPPPVDVMRPLDLVHPTKRNYPPFHYLKATSKLNHKLESNDAFDVYLKNELKGPKCGNERIHVYYNKNNKRKIRNLQNEKFCERS